MSIEDDDEEIEVNSFIKDPLIAKIFPYKRFNPMQSLIADQLLHTDDNMVIAAPTGAGKTVCHELAIVRSLQDSSNPLQDLKCVFIAPNRAICQQRAISWSKSFAPFGLSVVEITGDIEASHSLACVAKSNVVITTPEKWDALTRSWRKHTFLLGCVNLLLLDEIHHLHDDRGAVLETVVVRMRTVAKSYRERCPQKSRLRALRVIALSATLPNIHDIGQWLRCDSRGLHTFDETFRPVPLRQVVVGYPQNSNDYFFEKSLDRQVPDVIRKYAKGNQALVFCPTKKGTEDLCEHLASCLGRSTRCSLGHPANVHDEKLRSLMGKGYAYHHSGVSADDRAAVESAFIDRRLSALCATSTLAHGVNLPAFLVVVRGTNMWQGKDKGYQKIQRSMLMQMCGRAGRPGFDESGVAVVMTSAADKEHFESLINHCDVVESSLPTILMEALCAEIAEEVVTDIDGAISWLRDTFFYVRVHKNPKHYGMRAELSDVEIDDSLKDECVKTIHLLEKAEIISLDSETSCVTPQVEAHIMTRNAIKCETMATIMQIPTNCCPEKLLEELSLAEECQKPVARSQKKLLSDVHKGSRFSSKMKVRQSSHKTLALLAAAIERAQIKDNSMRVEQMDMVEQSMRVLSAIHSYALEKGKGKLLESTIHVRRSLAQRLWMDETKLTLTQAPNISSDFVKKIFEKQISLEDLSGKSQEDVQRLTSCSAADAQRLLSFGHACSANKALLSVDFTKIGRVRYSLQPLTQSTTEAATSSSISLQLVSYHYPTGKLVCYRKIASGRSAYETTVALPDEFSPDSIHTSLISEYVGLDVAAPAPIAATAEGSTADRRKRPLKQSKLQTSKVSSAWNAEAVKHERAQEIISKREAKSKATLSSSSDSTPHSPSGSSQLKEPVDSPSGSSDHVASKPFFKRRGYKSAQRQIASDNCLALSLKRRREEEKEDARKGESSSVMVEDARGSEGAIGLSYVRSKSREMGLDKVNVNRLKRNADRDEMDAVVVAGSPASRERRCDEPVAVGGSSERVDVESLKRRHVEELNRLLSSQSVEIYNANAQPRPMGQSRDWPISSDEDGREVDSGDKRGRLIASSPRPAGSRRQTPPLPASTYGHDFPDLMYGVSFKRQQAGGASEPSPGVKSPSFSLTVSERDALTRVGSSHSVVNAVNDANVDLALKWESEKSIPDKVRVVSLVAPDSSGLNSFDRNVGDWTSDFSDPKSRQELVNSAFF